MNEPAAPLPPAVGVDLVDCARIRGLFERDRERFLGRIFTAGETAYCLAMADPVPHLAARFAAKEAAAKALGCGIGPDLAFRDAEVVRGPAGRPQLRLAPAAAAFAAARGFSRFDLSLSHTREHAIAVVLAM
jgi:holo-[acyl-carrier protein] synthase